MPESSRTDSNPPAIGVFGGTFDPIHLGHTGTVGELMTLSGLEDVRFIPAASPPHRDRPTAAPHHRLEMTRLATADMPGVTVDDRELYRLGPSYTVDTLESIQVQEHNRPLCLIMGLDAVLGLESWYRWTDILDLASLVVMVRPDYTLPATLPDWWRPAAPVASEPLGAGTIRIMPITPTPISATAIRAAIARGESPADQLHPDVWHYIRTHHLYV